MPSIDGYRKVTEGLLGILLETLPTITHEVGEWFQFDYRELVTLSDRSISKAPFIVGQRLWRAAVHELDRQPQLLRIGSAAKHFQIEVRDLLLVFCR